MPDEGSVTRWIKELSGDEAAAAERVVFDRYFEKLAAVARQKLQSACRAARDEEDVALSAMDSFFRRAQDGDFQRLDDRHDLWALLATIASRKAINQFHRESALKRGGAANRRADDVAPDDGRATSLALLEGREPTPESLVQLAEEFRNRVCSLDDETLRRVAILKLQGHSSAEIAERLDIAERTVRRKIYRIRREWADALT